MSFLFHLYLNAFITALRLLRSFVCIEIPLSVAYICSATSVHRSANWRILPSASS